MMAIQIIIIVAVLAIFILGLRGRQTHVARAWKKIGMCLLVVAIIIAVIFPNTTNTLAHWVGVGRGADLLLYVLTLSFVAYALNGYVHQQADKDALYRLARKVALLEANGRYEVHKK